MRPRLYCLYLSFDWQLTLTLLLTILLLLLTQVKHSSISTALLLSRFYHYLAAGVPEDPTGLIVNECGMRLLLHFVGEASLRLFVDLIPTLRGSVSLSLRRADPPPTRHIKNGNL